MKTISYGNRATHLEFSSDFHYFPDMPDYDPETFKYAIWQFIKRTAVLRSFFSTESWRFRLAKGRAPRSRKHFLLVPASAMELPGTRASIAVTVDCEKVLVTSLILEQEPPEEE